MRAPKSSAKCSSPNVARIVVAHQHEPMLAVELREQPVCLLELLAKPHVRQVAGDDDDVGRELVELVDDARGKDSGCDSATRSAGPRCAL